MTDLGTPEERAIALRVAEACKELNTAIWEAAHIGVNVKIIDLADKWDDQSNLQVYRMERRTTILPSTESTKL